MWILWTDVSIRMPACSTNWAALSQCKLCEQEWCHFSSCEQDWWHFSSCEQEWCHFSSVSFEELHYPNINFVTMNDVIVHQKDSGLFHWMICIISTWTLWIRVIHVSSVPLKELHYLNVNSVNKSDVSFHQKEFHWMICVITAWTLWIRVMSCFISSIEIAALSQCEFCEQEWRHFFYWKYTKLLNHCDCVYLCNSKQRWCDISSEGFPSVPLNELHCPDVNFMDKSRVISGLQTLPLR